MPFRETYQVYNRQQIKAAQRERSFRSCLIFLIVFFFVCLIVLLANVPSWKRQKEGTKEQYTEFTSQREEHMTETTAIPTTQSTRQTTPSTKTDSIAKSKTLSMNLTTPSTKTDSTAENKTPSTNPSTTNSIAKSEIFEFVKSISQTTSNTATEPTAKNETLSTNQIIPSTIASIAKDETLASSQTTPNTAIDPTAESKTLWTTLRTSPLQEKTASTSESASTNKIDKNSTKPPIDESHSTEKINSTSIIHEEDAEMTTTNVIEQTLKGDVETTMQSNVIDINDALTSLNGSIVEWIISTLIYNTPIVISNVTISKSVTEETTTNYPDYSSSESSNEYSETFNITSSLNPSASLEEDTNAKYSSDKDDSEELQPDIMNNIMFTSGINDENIDDNKNSIDMNESQNILNDTSTTSSLPNDTENSIKYDFRSQFSNTTNTILANDAITFETITRDSSSASLSEENFSRSTIEKYTTNSIFGTTTTTLTSLDHSTIMTTTPTSYDTNFLMATTIFSNKNTNNTCNTNYCMQTVNKIILNMNHSADPCTDFYEYACGGFETNPLQIINMDQARRFSNYERIKKQMRKIKQENVNSTFAMYYDSCVKYEKNVSFSERIKMARHALDEVGKFYIKETADHVNFTDLFAKLILHHSAFLFDVVPELDEYNPNSFTLKISPTSSESFFKTEYMEESYSENNFETDSYHVDFNVSYDKYKTYKKQDEKDEIRKSISDALMILQIFKDLNNNNLELERINKTVDVIDSVIMQGYFSHIPAKNDTRNAYLMKNYTRISLKELEKEDSSAFINWTQLVVSLVKTDNQQIINKKIQVYFLQSMVKGLQELKEFAKTNYMDLHNGIMALYARKLYQELVLPKQNTKNHCLQVATYLLRPEATNLYVSSFADHEIERINKTTTNMFKELKETLKQDIKNATWAKGKGKQALFNKIDSLELTLPPVSYFKNGDLVYNDYNMSQNLSENYFNDSINLMKRYRTLMYTEIRRKFDISVQLWTYFATPFQSQTKMIYGLNQIMIPYGIIDWTTIYNEDSLNYISLATLGNIIALQIAHHFDELGIYYWNQTRNEESLMFEDSYTNKNFQDYISNQRENSFQESMHFLLPFTNQNVLLTIPQLAVNKQLSQRTGLRLIYDTLDRMRSKGMQEEVLILPWMKFHTDKLFYLAYTQTYCTKTPLTSSYVTLHESEDLPNRVLIFVTMFNNPLIDIVWGCPNQCNPKDVCSVFPDIYIKESI